MPEGWIKLHRQLLDKAIWKASTTEQRVILVTILLLANHEEAEWEWQGRRFKCQPGQFITSSTNLARIAGVNRQSVRSALKKFKTYEFLTYESTNTGLLITVANWAKYQGTGESPNQEPNQRPTNGQPRANQGVTTNKNDKNNKNDKKVIYAEFVALTPEEYQKLVNLFGEEGTKDRIENLNLYKGSTGKKYSSDYMTILRWERKNKESSLLPSLPKPKTYEPPILIFND